MFWMSKGLISASTCSSSASLGCRGKAAGLVLQVLRAQQRKLRVRSFILCVCVFLESVPGYLFFFSFGICIAAVLLWWRLTV